MFLSYFNYGPFAFFSIRMLLVIFIDMYIVYTIPDSK